MARRPCVTLHLGDYRPPAPKQRSGRQPKPWWHEDVDEELAAKIRKVISQKIWRAKHVVVMTGAGISVSSGIPDFRSMDGIYAASSATQATDPSASQASSSNRVTSSDIIARTVAQGFEAKDLFYYPHVFSDPVHFAEHLRFMAALKDETENIQWASVMHRFVGEGLIRNGKLSRWLTQNIDGLELRSTETGSRSDVPEEYFGNHSKKVSDLLVQLHGSVHELICSRCSDRTGIDKDQAKKMRKGESLTCAACEAQPRHRETPSRKAAERMTGPGLMRPSVVLYSEPPPPPPQADDTFGLATSDVPASTAAAQKQALPAQVYDDFLSDPIFASYLLDGRRRRRRSNMDSRGKSKFEVPEELRDRMPDFLLVVGTTLQIPGFQQIFTKLSALTRLNKGMVVFVNATDVVSSARWRDHFDYQVLGLADDWAMQTLWDWVELRQEYGEDKARPAEPNVVQASPFEPASDDKPEVYSSDGDGEAAAAALVSTGAATGGVQLDFNIPLDNELFDRPPEILAVASSAPEEGISLVDPPSTATVETGGPTPTATESRAAESEAHEDVDEDDRPPSKRRRLSDAEPSIGQKRARLRRSRKRKKLDAIDQAIASARQKMLSQPLASFLARNGSDEVEEEDVSSGAEEAASGTGQGDSRARKRRSRRHVVPLQDRRRSSRLSPPAATATEPAPSLPAVEQAHHAAETSGGGLMKHLLLGILAALPAASFETPEVQTVLKDALSKL